MSQQAANSAAGASKSQAKWLRQLADQMKKYVDEAQKSGVYNPDLMMKNARDTYMEQYQQAANNAASAFKIAGYRPGDTPVVMSLRDLANKYAATLANQSMAIKQNALLGLLQAYNMTGATGVGNAANIYANVGNTYQQSANQAFGGLTNLLAELAKEQAKKTSSATK